MVVRVNRRGAVVRRDGDHLAAVVTRLGDVVVPVDVGVDGVACQISVRSARNQSSIEATGLKSPQVRCQPGLKS